MESRVDRRGLLLCSAAFGASALAPACKRSETCPPSQLTAEDTKLRETLHYTDRSPNPDKLCNGCQQYLPNTDADCGGCKVIKGLIHPAGYCAAFSGKR
jgi:High potential iron-sulfur protein